MTRWPFKSFRFYGYMYGVSPHRGTALTWRRDDAPDQLGTTLPEEVALAEWLRTHAPPASAGWHKLTLPFDTHDFDCTRCGGTGAAAQTGPCRVCNGSGRHLCACGNEHLCGRCGGGYVELPSSPRVPCSDCDGTGRLSDWRLAVRVGEVILPNRSLRWMIEEIGTDAQVLTWQAPDCTGMKQAVLYARNTDRGGIIYGIRNDADLSRYKIVPAEIPK